VFARTRFIIRPLTAATMKQWPDLIASALIVQSIDGGSVGGTFTYHR
jgi:hypothetical protein